MNLPNKLTIFRIALVPICCLVWLFPYDQLGVSLGAIYIRDISIPVVNIVVLLIFAIASFTDFLDGRIARGKNMVTTFGKFADPIADKLLVNTMLIIMTYKHMIPVMPCVIMICRDIIVDGCRMIAAQRGVVISAGILGKLKTVLQMVSIIIIMLNNVPFELLNLPIDDVMIWFTSFVSIAGGYSYFTQVQKYIFESM